MSLRPTFVRLAASTSSAPLATSAFRRPDADMLPAKVLYRRLLRVHRKVLPREMRLLGDDYVKAEFRRTRTAENPLHLVGFFTEWQKYLALHEQQLEAMAKGEAAHAAAQEATRLGLSLSEETLEKLNAEQIAQLYELMQASKNVWMTQEELDAELSRRAEEEEAGESTPDLRTAHQPGGSTGGQGQ